MRDVHQTLIRLEGILCRVISLANQQEPPVREPVSAPTVCKSLRPKLLELQYLG